jgi:hypothetical protein
MASRLTRNVTTFRTAYSKYCIELWLILWQSNCDTPPCVCHSVVWKIESVIFAPRLFRCRNLTT